jgi:polysaccharide export outer membrane protein
MKRTLARLLAVSALAAATSFVLPAHAQLPTPRAEKKFVAYRITRSDRLSVGVVGESELTVGGKRVEATGTINLTYIGDINLVGLTIKEAQEKIANAYRDGRFLRNPVVTVTVDEYAPRTVIISGKVNVQGRQEIPPDTEITIKEMIFKAGGFSETAKGTAVRLTRTMPDGTLKVFTLDVESAIKGKEKTNSGDAAFVLEPDDIIYVPEKII